MALVKCSECGKEVSDKAGACPHCGNPMGDVVKLRQEVAQTKTNNSILIAIVSIMIILAIIYGLVQVHKNAEAQRKYISEQEQIEKYGDTVENIKKRVDDMAKEQEETFAKNREKIAQFD